MNFHGRNDSLLRRENRKKNTGRSFYADMPNIYEHGELQEVEDQMEGEEEEVVQEECIIYEEEHHLDEAEELEVIEEEEVVEEIVEQVVDDGVVVGEEM